MLGGVDSHNANARVLLRVERIKLLEQSPDCTHGRRVVDDPHGACWLRHLRFIYHRDPETDSGYFDEVIEPENPLVSSEQAQVHVEALRDPGLTYRQIARLAGVSVEAVHRSASGVGRIRSSTEQALLQVALSLTNGNGQR
jgi:hypothetical protein